MSGLFLLPHPSPLACFFGIIIDMHLELITVLGKKVDQEVYEVILPTADGEIAVYPGHEPLVSVAVPGAIAVRINKTDDDSKLDYYAISGGVIEVSQTYVRVLVDEAIEDNEIVEAETKAALDRAIAMRDNAKNQLELEKAHELVDRHTVRLKVAGLRRRHRR
jgi:F-type H+-transporting ATPase subunit epsilon